MNLPMHFDYLSWEAFATIMTGFAAVYAAYRVGQRQTDIQKKQVAIQERLAEIEQLKLRQALFEARWAVYDAARNWLFHVIVSGRPPYSPKPTDPDVRKVEFKLAAEFSDATHRSQFLFPSHVRQELVRMSQAAQIIVNSERKIENSTDDAERERAADQNDEAFTFLSSSLDRLPEIFGDEMRLTRPHTD